MSLGPVTRPQVRRRRLVAAALPLALSLSALRATAQPSVFIMQPAGERARQQLAPKSSDPLWGLLGTTPVHADVARGLFTASPPPEVRDLADQTLQITGFMLPLDPSPTFSHFLLTRNTPVCAFCPPGAPNEVIEVFTRTFVKPTSRQVTVYGHFSLQENGAAGLFFKLDDARIL